MIMDYFALQRQAIAMAKEVHADDVYGDKPYIYHCLRVMCNFQNMTCRIVAVLHDAYEDHPDKISLEEIDFLFGPVVRDAIRAISRHKGEDYFDYIHRCSNDEVALKVKLADLRENLWRCEPGDSRIKRYEKAIDILMAYQEFYNVRMIKWLAGF